MIFLPQPSSLSYGEGTFTIHYDSRIFLDSESPAELFSAAQLLQQEIETQTGFRPAICRRHQPVGSHLIYLTASPELSREAYTLAVTPENITICGSLKSGVLYGVQTLRQMIRQAGAVLPTVLISDKPAMENRGFYHDATRGRVPTLSYLKQLADTLSFYKINQLQLYIEHSYLFDDLTEMWRDDTPLTAEDILELDRYCKGLGIDLVPSLASFGHLYKLLCTKSYAHLCELEGSASAPFSFYDRQAHHTLDITNPESLSLAKHILSEYMQLFSSKYFNLCADETFDLGKGASRALAEEKGTTVIYTEFVTELANYITESGRTPMFWSDVISQEPEVYHLLPKNLICLHWDYASNVSSERLTRLANSGAEHLYVCPGVQGWNQLINKYHEAYENISRMARYGHECHAMGLLNTDWGDYGHINHPDFSRIGMIYGAASALFAFHELRVVPHGTRIPPGLQLEGALPHAARQQVFDTVHLVSPRSASDMGIDVVEDIAHGLEVCQLLIGDGHAAGLFQCHVQLHSVQAVGLQILGQAGFHGHLVLIAAQGIDNDLFHFLESHGSILLYVV